MSQSHKFAAEYTAQFKKLNDILSGAGDGKSMDLIWGPADADKLYHLNPAGEIDLPVEYHKYQPGDKARLNNDGTWVSNNSIQYTIKNGEILVIDRESDDLPNFYTFRHVDQLSPFSLIRAKDMKPVSPDTPHKCYCPRDTVIHHGCQCKGV